MTTGSDTRAAADPAGPGMWVMLSYRLPREPSTARIGVWRKLKRLGVAPIGDGVVALPADARTREHLEWIAEDITEAGGGVTVWLAQPSTAAAEHELAATLAAARAAEYTHLIDAAHAAADAPTAERAAAARRLRAPLRRIGRRDYSRPRRATSPAAPCKPSPTRARHHHPPRHQRPRPRPGGAGRSSDDRGDRGDGGTVVTAGPCVDGGAGSGHAHAPYPPVTVRAAPVTDSGRNGQLV